MEQFTNLSNVKGILADIGVSSYQLDTKARGFGFDGETLDMRMDKNTKLDASYVVNNYSQQELSKIFEEFGELKNAHSIASLIINRRSVKNFTSAKELAIFLKKNIKTHKKIHPATLVFQAIRIEVNGELNELKILLESIKKFKNTVVSIITFHSLEDRMVKNYFKHYSNKHITSIDGYKNIDNPDFIGKIINRKPITASYLELTNNKRSRSAKLRSFLVE